MNNKPPFNKENPTKISFEHLLQLIGICCDYKFSIIDEEVDDELKGLAAQHGIDLTGYKHIIETSGTQHAEKRHGKNSNDRIALSLEDYLLIPIIIRYRDTVEISPKTENSHNNQVLVYKKRIGDMYFYVEEIRKRNKSLAFKSLWKRETKNPSK